ncbi:DNA primase [Chryseobacterium formosense]|uniref:DNA primase n=1 Tax=Chryseobacterium formosense TaxID=236814 RepID=A0A085ZA60_9FLAO|nr:toprim domain-containing protein [Chryseobacterium formosense]KFF01324.1 DNA primase [Chryseobacterium formosense]SFT45627.1 CHC2 zinc finger [Chryseobacterium formosense]
MNCEEAKQTISIRVVLESFNLFPIKDNQRTAFYFALDREERTPSLSVDFIKNKAFDFGTGKSYDVISIVQQINQCSVADALKYLATKLDFSIQNVQPQQNLEYEILKVSEIRHFALIQYLITRRVYEQKDLVKEIHYEMYGKKYFGIGFINDSGGFEVRNKFSKICVGKKDVTWIKSEINNSNEVAIFEGFFDYLTFRKMQKHQNSDYLILNSTSMLFKIENDLDKYHKISLFLDNDKNGNFAKTKIQNVFMNAEDCSLIYEGYNDLNEWYCKD